MEKKGHGFSYAKYGYLFCIPFFVAYLVFNFYPTIYTILLGFTDSKGLGNINFHVYNVSGNHSNLFPFQA